MTADKPISFSLAQRIVHWAMALLIFFNLIFADAMEAYFDAFVDGKTVPPEIIANANIHAFIGISVLLLFVVRIVLRMMQGAPDAPDEEPPLMQRAAKIAHWSLYALMFLMPVSGGMAYFGGIHVAGFVHGGPMKLLMWVLIIGHIGGALVHQFYWKTDVLKRMTSGVKA